MESIDTQQLWSKIEDFIIEQAAEALPGKAKLKAVISKAADWLASQTKVPVPDAIEAAFYRTILWLPVQFVYDRLKSAGKV